jgi:hypothetical protein
VTSPLRDRSIGPAWLGFYALTKDEPPEMALEYIATAHNRVWSALQAAKGSDGKSLLPPAVVEELVDLKLFLVGLALAADPNVRTPVNLKLVRRKGRPKRTIVQTNAYRRAAHEVNQRKPQGYDAAVLEVAKETGLDRSEIEAWASHLERTEAIIAVGKIAAFFRSGF